MKYLIIYPKKSQYDKIKEYEKVMKEDILVVTNTISNEDITKLKNKIANEEIVKVLCCHEEGIYWLKNNIKDNFNVSFKKEYFTMLNKWNTYIKFIDNKIPCTYKTLNPEEIKKFPIIAKPNIGFGSIGVNRIDSKDNLKRYINIFDTMMKNSIVENDRVKFFENEKNFPVYEKCIDNGKFLSVPFIVDKSKKVHIFPVIGLRKENTEISNYKWSTFMYGKNIISKNLYIQIQKIIQYIANIWIEEPSVNLVEMIYDVGQDKINVLEFSPRTVGGRISKMIQYSCGLNLDDISIDLFFREYNKVNLTEQFCKSTIVDICNVDLCGKELTKYEGKELEEYKLVELEETKSSTGDNIVRYKIYERENNDDKKQYK